MNWKEMTFSHKITAVISAILLASLLIITIMNDANYLKNTRTVEYWLRIGAYAGIGFASQQTLFYFMSAFSCMDTSPADSLKAVINRLYKR